LYKNTFTPSSGFREKTPLTEPEIKAVSIILPVEKTSFKFFVGLPSFKSLIQ